MAVVARAVRAQSGRPSWFSGGGAVLDGGRLLALFAFEAAHDQLDLCGEPTGGAVAVAAAASVVENSAGARNGLLAGNHGAGHAAARWMS
ncbi:hypothetical protein ACFUTV_31650 [Streptomyces sp. NPDC057298]|uniref:hypothetical protein n=1 Tax=Streptomyces sp. NPDC057298 TaxID=3346091 RepID=UPI003628D62F